MTVLPRLHGPLDLSEQIRKGRIALGIGQLQVLRISRVVPGGFELALGAGIEIARRRGEGVVGVAVEGDSCDEEEGDGCGDVWTTA